MNYDARDGEAYGQLLASTIAHAGKTLDSIEWAIDVIDLLREADEIDEENATTLQSLIIEAVKAEFGSLKSGRSAKIPVGDPARNHPARASSGTVPSKS